MYIIIGSLILMIGVVGGYLIEKGNLSILIQPVEAMIIYGAALGALVTSTGSGIKLVISGLVGAFKHGSKTKKDYMELLVFFYEISTRARKEGLLSLESHFDNPKESDILNKYHAILHDEAVLAFICDNIKIAISIKIEPEELENLIDIDIESRTQEAMYAPHMLNQVSDSLPGLGIVAAVLGIVITMGVISEPPEVLGHHVAVALVGTFLGILSCYGFLGPIASYMAHHAKEAEGIFNVIKACIGPFIAGANPALVSEYGRRVVPPSMRPTSEEIEEHAKKA